MLQTGPGDIDMGSTDGTRSYFTQEDCTVFYNKVLNAVFGICLTVKQHSCSLAYFKDSSTSIVPNCSVCHSINL